MARRIPFLVILVGLFWFVQPVLAASNPLQAEIDPRVWQDLAISDKIDIIVRVRDLPALPEVVSTTDLLKTSALRQVDARIRAADTSQRNLRAELSASGVLFHTYWIVNLVALQANQAEIEGLAARPDVVYIESDRAFQVPLETISSNVSQPTSVDTVEPGITYTHAPDLWALGFKGQGAVVASADTGVAWDHPALKNQYRGWDGAQANHNYNWWDAIHTSIASNGKVCGLDSQFPCDDYGHGTHTVGTMVGDDGLGNQVGMAPDAKWIACRNMDGGVGRPTTYIECLQFFIAPTDLAGKNPDPSKRPDVIDNSYSCPPSELCSTTSLHEAVQQVRAAGIFMSVSAGNSGSSCATITDPPGLESGVFTVGAVDAASGNMAPFSSRGPVTVGTAVYLKPDLVAPGVFVRSSLVSGGYGNMSGTSMAAPHVAGAVALLWSAFPSLKRDVFFTETLLRASALPLPVTQSCGSTPTGSVPNNTSGWGILDVKSAYDNLLIYLNSLVYKSYFPVLIH